MESCQALQCGGLLLQRLRRRGLWGVRQWLGHCLLLRGNAPHIRLRKVAQGKAVESCQALQCGLLLQRLRRQGPWGLRWWLRHCLLLRGNAPHGGRKVAQACHLGHGGAGLVGCLLPRRLRGLGGVSRPIRFLHRAGLHCGGRRGPGDCL